MAYSRKSRTRQKKSYKSTRRVRKQTSRNYRAHGGDVYETARGYVLNNNSVKLHALLGYECVTGICSRTPFDINHPYTDDKNMTLLMYAIVGKFDGIVDLLLRYGARVTNYTTEGFTPMQFILHKGTTKSLELIIKKYPNIVHKQFPNGSYPLCEAARDGYKDKIQMLLNAGAQKTVCSREGYRPFNEANDSNIETMVEPTISETLRSLRKTPIPKEAYAKLITKKTQ